MSFESAIAFVLEREGGYVNDPTDKGGETNMGITSATLEGAKSHKVVPNTVTIANLTAGQATKIYEELFWKDKKLNMAGIDTENSKLATVVFDFAVNSGPVSAAKELQALVGAQIDGWVGPNTLKAIRDYGRDKVIKDFIARRSDWYYRIIVDNNSQVKFAKGWRNRLKALEVFIGVKTSIMG